MSELPIEKRVPRTGDTPSDKGDERTMKNKQSLSLKDKQADSSAIERAVYDGMHDLRSNRSKQLRSVRRGKQIVE